MSLLVADNENPVDFDNAIGILEAFSFVTVDEMGTTYSIHRLVQAATRAWLRDQQDCNSKNIASQALQMLSSRFPDGEFENWTTCARYLPHAESVLSRGFEDRSEADSLARAKLLSMVAKYLRKQGKFSLAKAKAKESLDIYKTICKPDCAEALQAKTEFATIIRDIGDTESAIKLYRETLKVQENLLGNDHLDTLETVIGLACVLTDVMMSPDDYKEAELLARRALVGREKALPINHPKTLASIHRLGWSIYRQNRYSEAEILFMKCKTQREIVLGDLHPDTCATTNSLALVLSDISKYEEAEQFLRHSARVTSMLCGVEHHEAIISKGNLGGFLTEYVILRVILSCVRLFWVMRQCFTLKAYITILQTMKLFTFTLSILSKEIFQLTLYSLGKYKEAEMLFRDQLTLSERILGKDHPTTIWCIENLSYILRQQEKFEQAETLLREQLLLRQQLPRTDSEADPDIGILPIMTELANVLSGLEKTEEAILLFNQVLAGWRRAVGENHPETLQTLHRIGNAYESLKDFDESEKYFRKAMVLRQSVLGENDIATLQSAKKLGDVLHEQKKYQEAETWFRWALIGREKTLGDSHKSTLSARDDLESVLFKQKKWGELVERCRKSLDLRRKLGPECYETLRLAGNLALALKNDGNDEWVALYHEAVLTAQTCYYKYMEQGNHEEAILAKEQEMYLRYVHCGAREPETIKLRRAVALLYEETGKHDDAEKAFKDLLEVYESEWGVNNPETLDLKEELAQLLDKHGKPEEATKLRNRRQQPPPFDSLSSISLSSSRSSFPSQGSKSGSPIFDDEAFGELLRDLNMEFDQLHDNQVEPGEASERRSPPQRPLSLDSLFAISLSSPRSRTQSQGSKRGSPVRESDDLDDESMEKELEDLSKQFSTGKESQRI